MEEKYITFELFSTKERSEVDESLSREEKFKVEKHNLDIEFYHRSICVRLRRGTLLYTSIISPRKETEFKGREAEAFFRSKTMINYLNEKFPVAPSVVAGRTVRYPPTMYLCLYCGKVLPFTNDRFCRTPADCFSNYYNKYNWNWVRDRIIRRDNFQCQICKKKGEYLDLEVDHIKAVRFNGNYFDNNNLRTVCKDCHRKKTREDIKLISIYNKLFRELDEYFTNKDQQQKMESYWKRLGVISQK